MRQVVLKKMSTKIIALTIIFIFVPFITVPPLGAQETTGYIKIECPQEGLPIFLDDAFIGTTPISEKIAATVGAHKISFWGRTSETEMHELRAALYRATWYGGGLDTLWADIQHRGAVAIIQAGTKDIYVQPGATVTGKLDWNDVERAKKALKEAETTAILLLLGICIGLLFLYAVSHESSNYSPTFAVPF